MARSGIREIMDLAWGRSDVIRLEVGEPNFDTPSHVVEAAMCAARDGKIRYTPNAGLPELREALAEKVRCVNGISATTDSIIVTHGAVEGIFSTLAAVVEAGDEILVPDPGWPNYRMMSSVLGARAVGYRLVPETGYSPDLDELRRCITARTRVIIVNSPSNPLGTILTVRELENLVSLAERYDLWVISDECYDQVVFDDSFVSTAAIADGGRVISAYSFSKTYAMTGWRVGYLVLPDELRDTVARIQEPVISCVSGPAQYAALAALAGPQYRVAAMVASYRHNRDLAETLLRAADTSFVSPAGAFYLWLYTGGCEDGAIIARRLVLEHGVAVAPGPTFGPSGCHALRISLAASEEKLTEGIRRILASGLVTGATEASLAADRTVQL
jgi:aspartate/methionine/tyrosine aminotransferase